MILRSALILFLLHHVLAPPPRRPGPGDGPPGGRPKQQEGRPGPGVKVKDNGRKPDDVLQANNAFFDHFNSIFSWGKDDKDKAPAWNEPTTTWRPKPTPRPASATRSTLPPAPSPRPNVLPTAAPLRQNQPFQGQAPWSQVLEHAEMDLDLQQQQQANAQQQLIQQQVNAQQQQSPDHAHTGQQQQAPWGQYQQHASRDQQQFANPTQQQQQASSVSSEAQQQESNDSPVADFNQGAQQQSHQSTQGGVMPADNSAYGHGQGHHGYYGYPYQQYGANYDQEANGYQSGSPYGHPPSGYPSQVNGYPYPGSQSSFGSPQNNYGSPFGNRQPQPQLASSLNLFNLTMCLSQDGRTGVCMDGQKEGGCGSQGGELARPSGARCQQCCVFTGQCHQVHHQPVINVLSPGYPSPYTPETMTSCPITIQPQPGVCQVRIDFLDFQVGRINREGRCDFQNALQVSTKQRTKGPPKFWNYCGTMSFNEDSSDPSRLDVPHQYYRIPKVQPVPTFVRFRPPPPKLSLTLNAMNLPSRYNIRVTQIFCNGTDLQAPEGCDQYYRERFGKIVSPNYMDGMYMANVKQAVCIKSEPGDCGVRYRLGLMGVGATRTGNMGYGLVCRDYIMFRGEKTAVCGRGDGREFLLPASGPAGFTFVTDSQVTDPRYEVGYNMKYEFLQNCDGSDNAFTKYPKAN